jgi:transcriptional regulator with XRE-family HTH domain
LELNTFSELLKKFRFKENISQEELGKRLDVCTMTIHRWEKGTHIPSKMERERVESFINDNGVFIDPYELLTEELKNVSEKLNELTEYLKKFHS